MPTPREGWIYVGTFTHEEPHAPGACGPGIVACTFDSATGQLQQRHVYRDIRNASYLAFDSSRRLFASTSENLATQNFVNLFERNADGSLSARGVQPSRGVAVCHLCFLPNGGVCGASYLQGCITVFPIQDGQLGPVEYFCDYEGTGPNKARQEGAHAHQAVVSPDGRWLYVCDLGADMIWVHEVQSGKIRSNKPVGIAAPAGCGPRHLEFHPMSPLVYVLGELNGRVYTYEFESKTGYLRLLTEAASCAHRVPEQAAAAAIHLHPSARTLYISDRKESELVVYKLDDKGLPVYAGRFSSGGKEPRDFAFDASGRWLIVGNQHSNYLSVFELDTATGLPLGGKNYDFPLNSPACVLSVD